VSPRIATLDIETSLMTILSYGIRDQYIGLDQIEEEWTILSYSWKWLDSPTVIYEDTGGKGRRAVKNDKPLLKSLHKLLDAADIVIAQNGRKFDLKKIRARMVMHGIPPFSPVRIIDTWVVAKETFGFTSDKLEWMSEHLTNTPKLKHKKFPGKELWKECRKDNPAAWAEMKAYNKRDVVATERVYLAMRPWIEKHPNIGTYARTVGAVCRNCGSGHLQKRGTEVTDTGKFIRMKCVPCGKWNRAKENLIPLAQRKRQLASA